MKNTLLFLIACCSSVFGDTPQLTLIATYPHDEAAFTQGLFFDQNYLYESTGQYGQSTLRKVDPKTGQVLLHVNIPKRYFAEGLTLADGKMYQLTWQENICFVFDKSTLEKSGDFQYKGEGWGLTFDGTHLVMSDGSATLQFIDPKTFKQTRKVTVKDGKNPVVNLNELEMIRGEVWANVWQTTKIVRIDPKTGSVSGWIDFAAFIPKKYKNDGLNCVLNGIAFDSTTQQVYITGKNWNVMYVFQIKWI